MREPAKDALSRTDAVILMKPFKDFEVPDDVLDDIAGQLVITAWMQPKFRPIPKPLFAFAGIGRPNKFFDALRHAGGNIVEEIPYPDHHNYSQEDILSLTELSEELGAELITTEKDHVRLPAGFAQNVMTWPIEVKFEDELTLRQILRPLIEQARAS